MNSNELYRKQTRLKIHEPQEIITNSFGTDSALGMYLNQYVSLEERRGYLLRCGHVIKTPEEMGGVCAVCLEEAEQQNLVSPEWNSLICVHCFRRCSHPFCPLGLCPEHAGQHEDKWYCTTHFDIVEEEQQLEGIRNAHGTIASLLVRFVKSLYFGDKRSLQ